MKTLDGARTLASVVPPPTPSQAGDAVLLGAAYFTLSVVALLMALQPNAITDIWFANAAAIAVLATADRRRWPLLLGSIAFAGFAAMTAVHGRPLLSATFIPGHLLEVMAGAWLLQRTGLNRRFDEDGVAYAAAVAVGGLLPQLLGATIGAALLHGHGFVPFGQAWVNWAVDSTLGSLALLPFVLGLRKTESPQAGRELLSLPALALLVVTVALVLLAFRSVMHPFVFLTLPLVASVFFVPPLVTFGLGFALVGTVYAGLNLGWIDVARYAPQNANVMLYLPAAAAVLPAQLMAVVVQRMRRLQHDTATLTMVGSDAAVLFDAKGVFRGANRAYERFAGRAREALMGRTIEQATPARYARIMRERFDEAMATRQPVQSRAEVNTAIGPRVLQSSYEPIVDERGQATGLLLSSHDVTPLVQAQRDLERSVAQLRAANEGMQQFVRIASHDMREPLNTIVQFCDLIESDFGPELDPTARLYFEHVRGGAYRMRALLDDVLSFARLERATDLRLRPIALNPVLDAVQRALSARIVERRAAIEVDPLPSVQGHESLLVLLFQNLLSNAIKFTLPEHQPQARVHARETGDGHVVVTVADRGIGIPPDAQKELFVPFKRLHARRQYDGTGLGLAISKRIVELMSGTIELESQPGLGTQLHVRLRLAQAPASAAQPAAARTA